MDSEIRCFHKPESIDASKLWPVSWLCGAPKVFWAVSRAVGFMPAWRVPHRRAPTSFMQFTQNLAGTLSRTRLPTPPSLDMPNGSRSKQGALVVPIAIEKGWILPNQQNR
jgi:hypothetical protein